MKAWPAGYVVASHLRPADREVGSVPALPVLTGPRGGECPPGEPPGLTMICAMAMSVPNLSGMLPCDVSVPRAKGMFVSPDGGVASLGVTVSIVTRPAIPTLSAAHLTDRFMPAPCDRGVSLRGVACRV